MKKFRVASLFCGCGGTDVGIVGDFTYLGKYYQALGTDIVYANDFEKSACNIFEENFSIKVDNRDIREVLAEDIDGDIDILTGGFPCQSFSVVAQNPKRLGVKDAQKGMLFFEMCRLIREKKPKCFIAENVKGILSANGGEAFPLILQEFSDAGYDVKHFVVGAKYYGIPQKRERVLIIGFRKDLHVTNFELSPPPLDDTNLIPLRVAVDKTVADKYFFSDRAVAGMKRNRESMNKGRSQNLDEPCNTVGAHLAKVSLNSTDPVLYDNGRYRRFTPREVARIQSFPDEFKLIGPETAQYRTLGNAIPPVMFWYVTRDVLRALKTANASNR